VQTFSASAWGNRKFCDLKALVKRPAMAKTMRYYVGRNANVRADAVWSAYEKLQEGTVLGTVDDIREASDISNQSQLQFSEEVAKHARQDSNLQPAD
jgi:hypothetical protein